jgi:hypothetical protein
MTEKCLRQLEGIPALPFSIEHIQPSAANEAPTSRYDPTPAPSGDSTNQADEIPFQNVVITDVDGHASYNELRAAAFRHVNEKGGGYIQVPHDHVAENEFRKDSLLFPMIYPTLFHYGMGGPEDARCSAPVSLKRHVKHLFNLADSRF